MESDTNPIIEELQMVAMLPMADHQKRYFNQMLADAKPVQCTPLAELFSKEELAEIRRVIRPRKHQCYNNALKCAESLPDKIKYVEGFGWNGLCKVEHAFNRIGNVYVDITWDMVLGHDVTKEAYVSLIEDDAENVLRNVAEYDNITGDYYRRKYIESLGGIHEVGKMLDDQAEKALNKKDGTVSDAIHAILKSDTR